MSNFVVSARKYRPVRFDEVVGQQHVTQTLKNALQNDKLAHAFLFCGPRGVGKTTCARILAKVLNCQNVGEDFEPCDTCASCRAFNQNASFNITELDAASNNSVEHIRALIEQVRFQPQQGKYKVFIIDEVHMLSQQAFNAFLKTLEEPPPYAIFILATTEKHKIIPTILSRCQIFDFRRIQVPDMVAHLQAICEEEGIDADKDALHIIGQKADGALRDSLSIFDRIVSFSGKRITYQDVIGNLNVLDYDYYFRTMEALLAEDAGRMLLLLDDVLRKGFDADIFVNGLAEHLRNLLVCKDPETLELLEVSDGLKERYRQQAAITPATFLLTALNIANDCDVEYKQARNKRLHVEIALIKMAYIGRAVEINRMPESPKADPEKKSPPPEVNSEPEQETAQEASAATPAKAPSAGPDKKRLPAEKTPPPTPPVEKGKAPVGRRRAKAKMHALLQVEDPEAIAAKFKQEENRDRDKQPELTYEALKQQWERYVKTCEHDSVRMVLRNTGLRLQKEEITAVVGSQLAESTLRQESALMDFLRNAFQTNRLVLNIEIDESKAPKTPKRKKPMTDKEKFLKMAEVNPVVREVQKRFDLRPD